MSSSKNQKRAALNKRLERLRTITNSTATSKVSIVADASNYIEDLKQKVATLNQETSGASSRRMSFAKNELPKVRVETLQKGFLINVFSNKNCPGLLVSILEAFENLGLDVLDARVSCTDTFQLEAVGGEISDDNINAQMVKQAVLQAIQNWSEQD